ncbi:histone deacetylase 1-like isoform X2 [Chenopodium quinoa]|uniref:histone deacetylase 1-like isoform X2 n=1 Tax=Chenopodium quinoa TaxID=63459 RepID=UPI000B78E10B|nr:histone deacetylase 1-like isoform X2 [Chenopodium quinoa]
MRVENIIKRPPRKGKAKEVESKNDDEDHNSKRTGTVVANKRRSKNASTKEEGQGLPQKGISFGKKRLKVASSSRDEQAKRQKKRDKLGKKKKNQEKSSDPEDEDEEEKLKGPKKTKPTKKGVKEGFQEEKV